MYNNTQEKAEQIKEMYLSGIKLTQICEETKTSQPTVKKILASFGIDYDTREKEKYLEKLDLVLKLYEKGKSQIYIEKELNLTRKTIRELIKNKEVHYKSKSEQCRLRYGHTLREDAFETITSESAYWIGMLYTDGHIGGENARGYNIELGLQGDDINHLEKYKKFLNCNISLSKAKHQNYLRVKIGSERLHKSLQNLGFTNKKSYDAIPHESVQNSKDFWRGCLDGDGGIYNRRDKYKQISLCGTIDTIWGFIEFCENNIGLKNKKSPTQCAGKCLYEISYYGVEAFAIADLLYKDSTVYLDRKYKVYQEWISEKENLESSK